MPPLIAFTLGTLFSEIMQWAIWGLGHPGKKPRDYFNDGVWHFIMAWGVCGLGGLLWAMEGLDFLTGMLPDAMTSAWADTGVPYTPKVGVMLGFGCNFMADKIAFALRARFKPAEVTGGGA